MYNQENRPRGMLTPKDRELLRGEIEYEHPQQYSNRRRDIRERIANGLLDFNVIQYLLRDKDRKLIFRDPSATADVDDPPFVESIQSMLYWTYLGLREQNYDFEGLLVEAIEEATEDFARKYWGESVETTVRFDIEVKRKYDVDDLITAVENGGPVKANQVYDLLELSSGVPIDTSKLDTLSVEFQSSYPEGEKAVLKTIFSEYLNTEVEIEDALHRVDLTELGIEKNSAVAEKKSSRPEPGEVKNYRPSFGKALEDSDKVYRFPKGDNFSTKKQAKPLENNKSISDRLFDEMYDWSETGDPPRRIYDLIDKRKEQEDYDKPVTPKIVLDLLEEISNSLVSTIEVAAALGCAPDAAQQALDSLFKNGDVLRQSVIDSNHKTLYLWKLKSELDD